MGSKLWLLAALCWSGRAARGQQGDSSQRQYVYLVDANPSTQWYPPRRRSLLTLWSLGLLACCRPRQAPPICRRRLCCRLCRFALRFLRHRLWQGYRSIDGASPSTSFNTLATFRGREVV